MENKKKKFFPLIALVCVAIMVIALGSYALWQITEKQTNKNVVGTACLSIDLENESGDISLENGWPISDSEGANSNPYIFTVTNHCDKAVNYIVGLESLEADINNGESSDYLSYDYIRVKLDNGSPKTYGTLDSISSDSGVRETKEITHHTLAANSSTTHYLRLWVDENTPLQNADESYNTDKYFYGKIKIVAGQNIAGDTPVTIAVVSGDINTAGSEVQIGDEHFYVLGDDEETSGNVKLLAKYNLMVGDSRYVDPNIQNQSICESSGKEWYGKICYVSEAYNSSTPGYNRQTSSSHMLTVEMAKYIEYSNTNQEACENAGGNFNLDNSCHFATTISDTRFDNIAELGEASIDDIENDSVVSKYNAVTFSDSEYWFENGNLKSDYEMSGSQMVPYIYYTSSKTIDPDNTISTFVNNYKDILENDYRISITEARLISAEEVIVPFCEFNSDGEPVCDSAPDWLFSSGYWSGSMITDLGVLLGVGYYENHKMVISVGYDYNLFGVRPVISVSKSIFN